MFGAQGDDLLCYSHSVMDGDWDWLVDLRVYGMDK